MNNILQKLQAARYKAIQWRPYLASALFRMPLIENEEVATMAVDARWRCYYSPTFVEQLSVDEIAGVLLHEVYHLISGHHDRLQGIGQPIAGIAADLAINSALRREGIPLPKDPSPLYPELFDLPDGLTAEEYAEHLMRHADAQEQQQAGKGDETGSETQGKQGKPGARPTAGRSGSCAYPERDEWELPDDEGDAVKEGESQVLKRTIAEQIQQRQRERGDVPAYLQRVAETTLKPTPIDWRRHLAAAVRQAVAAVKGMGDYARHRPSRRSAAIKDVVLPGWQQPVPRVGIIVDTSGSISDTEIAAALKVIGDVLAQVGEVRVLAVDADVHSDKVIRNPRDLPKLLVGGGGTDLRVGFERFENSSQRPSVVVVITDGETPFPPRKPEWAKRVIVALHNDHNDVPEWATTVRLTGGES